MKKMSKSKSPAPSKSKKRMTEVGRVLKNYERDCKMNRVQGQVQKRIPVALSNVNQMSNNNSQRRMSSPTGPFTELEQSNEFFEELERFSHLLTNKPVLCVQIGTTRDDERSAFPSNAFTSFTSQIWTGQCQVAQRRPSGGDIKTR